MSRFAWAFVPPLTECQPCASRPNSPSGKTKPRVMPASEVDHIIPKFEGGSDDADLAAICHACHVTKSAHTGVRARDARPQTY
jgi:5-methylcytosine-specific restriction endonuclease McrA